MCKSRKSRAYRFFAVLLTASGLAMASGSYSARPPSPMLRQDEVRYETGKAIFQGPAKAAGAAMAKPVGSASDIGKMRARLASLHEKLPPRVRNTVSLPDLAGRIKSEEMAALEFFLEVRFKVK